MNDDAPLAPVVLPIAVQHDHDDHIACPTCGELVPPWTARVHEVLAHPRPRP